MIGVSEFFNSKIFIGVVAFVAGVLTRPIQREIERQIDKRRMRSVLYKELARIYDDIVSLNDIMNGDPHWHQKASFVIDHPRYDAASKDVLYESLGEAVALTVLYRTLAAELKSGETSADKRRITEESRVRMERTILQEPFIKSLFYKVATSHAAHQLKSRESLLRS